MKCVTFYKCIKCCGNEEPCVYAVFGTADKPKVCPIINEEEAQSEWIETNEFILSNPITR